MTPRAALAPVHRRYAGAIHARQKRTGHFWQGRYGAVVMDEDHLAAAVKHVLLNPVRAGLADRAQHWCWSSAGACLEGADDGLTDTGAVLACYPDIAAMLETEEDSEALTRLRAAETIGRPLGGAKFLAAIEQSTGRKLAPGKRGRKPGREMNALAPSSQKCVDMTDAAVPVSRKH